MPKFEKMKPVEEEKDDGTVRFISRYASLQMSMIPGSWTFDTGGNRIVKPGKMLKFRNGIYETKNPAEIEFVRKHAFYQQGKVVENKASKKEETPSEE